jgi:hypothetical protein
MQRVIILNLVCVSALLLPLKLGAKVESPDSGVPGKLRWLQSNIKQKVGDTNEKVL